VLASIHDRGPGLIITGQGDSATRVASALVTMIGTHRFGQIRSTSKDSCFLRGCAVGLIAHDVVTTEGRFPYNFSLPGSFLQQGGLNSTAKMALETQSQAYMRVCAALRLHSECGRDDGVPDNSPWALKEPLLRYMLPVVEQMLGRRGFKLVHMTRDVREITRLYEEDKMAEALAETRGRTAEVVRGTEHVWRARWNKTSVETVIRFQLVWAHVESAVRRRWQGSWPEGYFHLSELKLLQNGTSTVRALAEFLGLSSPSPKLIARMADVYHRNPPHEGRFSRSLRYEVAGLEPMGAVRATLLEFGYPA
jgi:hypothetical protein